MQHTSGTISILTAPLGKALQLAFVSHGASPSQVIAWYANTANDRSSHVLHDTRHKGCHLVDILQRQNSLGHCKSTSNTTTESKGVAGKPAS